MKLRHFVPRKMRGDNRFDTFALEHVLFVVVFVRDSAVTTAIVVSVCGDDRFLAVCRCTCKLLWSVGAAIQAHRLSSSVVAMSTRNRPMQDFVTWPAFGTKVFWDSVQELPEMALELICQRVHELGGINPSEPTSREVAAHAAVAKYGYPGCATLAAEELNNMFDFAKASACMCTPPFARHASGDNRLLHVKRRPPPFARHASGDNRLFYLTCVWGMIL